MAHLSYEAAAYWRGLGLMSDTRLSHPCASLDVVFDSEADHAGASAFSRLGRSADSAGARCALLGPSEVSERLGTAPLRLPAGAAALLQPDAGLLLAAEAAGAAAALAVRAGAAVKERLQLRGWRDAGGYFRVEASSALLPDSMSVFEAEQLLLAPGAAWAPECLQLFGLQSDLEVMEVVSGGWLAGDDASKLPLWQFWGAAPGAQDAPAGLTPCYGLPALPGGRRAGAGQLSWQGRRVSSGAFDWGPLDPGAAADRLERAAASIVRGAAFERPPGSASDDDGDGDGEGRGGAGAGRAAAGGRRPRRRLGSQLLAACSDGLPVIGYHPGLEAGRALVCCCASGSEEGAGGGLSAFQLAPVVAKLSVDILTGRSAGETLQAPSAAAGARGSGGGGGGGGGGSGAAGGRQREAAGAFGGGSADDSEGIGGTLAASMWASRPAVRLREGWPGSGGANGAAGIDTLAQLHVLQRRREGSALDAERAADEASDARRDEKGRVT